MPLHSSVRKTHERFFGSGTAAKFRPILAPGISAETLPFSFCAGSAKVKLKEICQEDQAARLKRK